MSRCSYVVRQPSKITYLDQSPTWKCQKLGRDTRYRELCHAGGEQQPRSVDRLPLSRNFTSSCGPEWSRSEEQCNCNPGSCGVLRERLSAPVPLHQRPRRITGTTTAILMFTATFKPSMGRVEEGVTAGPTYESMGRSGSDRPSPGESAVSSQYM